ncbi:bcl-2-binding component 3 isoform X1 [Gracilinanus agilis]|uniref:bcl-2-binding component 3 isoform X1 n=1 Tax=Gracilinanus agilis TaxID=191870 RepID=UPI001CFE3FE9|nr:bcl-2-binding component 3 isoform X1 [Gracilinanus agilis]
MARAQQDGSSPEPVEGLPREGPRTFPLGRLMPSAVSCSLCEAGLNPSGDSMCPAPGPALAPPSLLPLAYFCTRQPRAYGGPRWARVARSPAAGSQGQSGSQPSLGPRSAEEEGGQEGEPQGASPMSGGPPGVLGPEHGDQGEQQDREIGAQLRRMADDLNALYEQRVSEGREKGPAGLPRTHAGEPGGRGGVVGARRSPTSSRGQPRLGLKGPAAPGGSYILGYL